MKLVKFSKFFCILLGVILIQSTSHARSIITDYTNTFDNNGNTTLYQNNFMYWYSLYADCIVSNTYNINMTNDPTMDAAGDTNVSGSLLCVSPFAPRGSIPPGGYAAIPSYGEQNLMSGTFDGGLFDTNVQMLIASVTNISFDIHVQPGTPTDANGNFGTVSVGLKSIGYNADTGYYTNQLTIPGAATNGWVHLAETNAAQFQYAAAFSGDTYAQGPEIYYTSYGDGGYPTNLVIFWIDNLVVNSSVAPPPPPPPPTMKISPADAGLTLFTGTGTSLYNRESLETTANTYTWVGASSPVSYAFTITNYPVGPNDAVQNHIFLIPKPGTESAPDYTEPNLVFLDLERAGFGAQWNFRYKTNEPNGNAMVYGNGTLATLNYSNAVGAVGTWTATFAQNTNVTMTAPDGTSTNFSIPDTTGATTALFSNGVVLYYGVQAGNTAGTQDHIVASEFKVTGTAGDFDDNFAADNGTLNTGTWQVNAAYPACVQMAAPGNPYWVQWTEPALGYGLVSTPSLTPPATWTLATNNSVFLAGTNFTELVSTNDLPPGPTAFLAVVQRTFTQLLILLPGETLAPNTATGKTGTPASDSIAGENGTFTFTVLAVDSHFNPITGVSDTLSFSDNDGGNYSAPDILANGSGQFMAAFSTTNNAVVITASDLSNTNIPSANSTAFSVVP
jgi:hypothetical protein